MYQKTTDLMDLATFMQASSEGVSIQDIMDKFKVSRRTAIRMKDAIKLKYPNVKEVTGEQKVKRWSLSKEDNFSSICFSLDEINALQNAVKLMKTTKNIDADYLENVLHKIKALLGRDAFNKIEPDAEVLLETEGYALRPGPKLTVNKEFMAKLRNAILACKQIRIKYQSKTSDGWRTVYPYGFLYGNKHYLIAWHTKRFKMCHFDLNNISEIEVLDKYFARDEKFSLQKFSENSFGIYQEAPFDVEWLFDSIVAKDASKYQFHPSQQMTFNEDGSLTVKFRAGGAREMDWHLYTWGEHVKVIKPKDFNERKVFKNKG
ncbi:MAG: WYL domain-containing protein [Alphaproteobacteria bacterium]|nr:WYL domain-containing protein [Alphaproteobacteria bacterium]